MSYDNRVGLDLNEYNYNQRDTTQSDVYRDQIGDLCLDILEVISNYDTELTETELKEVRNKFQDLKELVLSHVKTED